MFSTFPTKPIPHSPRLRQSRQAHRSAIIYEPNLNKLPARPQAVRTQPERPVPVIQLPGLPPRSLPKSIVKSDPKNWPEVSKNWLAQFNPFKKIRETTPPTYTPRTAKFIDTKIHHKADSSTSVYKGPTRRRSCWLAGSSWSFPVAVLYLRIFVHLGCFRRTIQPRHLDR
jgi:hypothetical protein